MRLSEIEIPDTTACRAALEVATAYCSPALLNHSVRAYLWAAGYAATRGIAFDAELLYVSAMLHDLALVKEFDNHSVPFEEAGGHVAWVFGAGAGWPVARRRRAAEVIVRHMWDAVDVAADPEGHLLELSTGMDISGRRTADIPADLRRDVLARYPRAGLAEEFVACFRDQAARKPQSLAAKFVASGFAARVAANPLDR
jgi:HD domain-containing protein